MGGGGSISAMIASLKNNKIPKRDRSKLRDGVPIGDPLKYKNVMNEKEFAQFKTRLEKKKKRRTLIHIIIYLLVFGLCFGLTIGYFLN